MLLYSASDSRSDVLELHRLSYVVNVALRREVEKEGEVLQRDVDKVS